MLNNGLMVLALLKTARSARTHKSTGGPRIVQILGPQGIVLFRNHTKQGLVLST